MPTFLHPGVYVLEVPSGARSIEAASTSTALFAGPAERGPLTAERIFSRTEYSRKYGGYVRGSLATAGGSDTSPTLAYAMDAFFANGGSSAYILRVPSASASGGGQVTASRTIAGPSASSFMLNATSPGAWATAHNATIGANTYNFGVYAIVAPSSDNTTWPATPAMLVQDPVTNPNPRFRIVVVYTTPGTTTQQIVEDWDHLSILPGDENYVIDVLKRSLYIAYAPDGNGMFKAVLPLAFDVSANSTNNGPPTVDDFRNAATSAGGFGLGGGKGDDSFAPKAVDYNLSMFDDITDASLLVLPSIGTDKKDAGGHGTEAHELTNLGLQYVENRPKADLFFIGTLHRNGDPAGAVQSPTDATMAAARELGTKSIVRSTFGSVYWPWVNAVDPAGVGKNPTIWLGPSPHVAGIFARTDNNRGVWKAPAGLDATISHINNIEWNILDAQQDVLNPVGINALRNQPAAGNVVWGARTLRPDTEWRYVPVRRMAIFLRVSIYNGIQFAVFEPNDAPLWAALRLAIGGFMDRLFRQGAFAGASARDAYFVKCDAETTNQSDQLAGFVNVLVGFSPLRPAEFVVVRLSQMVSTK